MTKRIFALLTLVFALALVFCSCDSDDSKNGESVNEYTVCFMDEVGNKITEKSVSEGQVPSYTYEKADTAEWDYTFCGWSASLGGETLSSLPAASADATYYAKVSQVKRTYTIRFVTNGGSSVESITSEYGSVIEKPETPEYEGFRFVGWYTDEALENEVDWEAAISANTTYYAKWNKKVDIAGLLVDLLSGYGVNPYSYVPESMRPDFSSNVLGVGEAQKDYSASVSVSNIAKSGHGEQWQMVMENISQSMTFFNILSVVEGLTSTSVSVFNNYIDKNPDSTAHHSFASGMYNVTISFDGNTLYYVLDYTATVAALGEQSIQIALSMDTEAKDKTVRVQIGDANALKYTVTENSYEFALRLLGVRRAYFSISKNKDNTSVGHIYEYLTAAGVEIASAADFYINDDYITAVGNKADGMLGFTGYICELYDTDSGRMLGYEVKETLSSITYNTLWFNLYQIGGINSVKYNEATDDEKAAFYINGSSAAFKSKNVGGFSLKTASRRFDIEFRTQYFYEYDSAAQEYKTVSARVPMLFVQEENYNTLITDIKAENNLTVSVLVSAGDLNKLKSDYATLVDKFIAGKELYTVDFILSFIGTRVVFVE